MIKVVRHTLKKKHPNYMVTLKNPYDNHSQFLKMLVEDYPTEVNVEIDFYYDNKNQKCIELTPVNPDLLNYLEEELNKLKEDTLKLNLKELEDILKVEIVSELIKQYDENCEIAKENANRTGLTTSVGEGEEREGLITYFMYSKRVIISQNQSLEFLETLLKLKKSHQD